MKAEDFEQMYETVRPKAIKVAAAICGGAAEDAVQEAVLYFLPRLNSNRTITPALFLYRVSQRAKDAARARGVDRNRKRNPFPVAAEIALGLQDELAALEMMQMPLRGRRTPPAPRAE